MAHKGKPGTPYKSSPGHKKPKKMTRKGKKGGRK